VFELMNRQPLMSTGGTLTPGSLQGDVEFKDVSFAYTARPDVQVGGRGALCISRALLKPPVGFHRISRSVLKPLLNVKLATRAVGKVFVLPAWDGSKIALVAVNPQNWRFRPYIGRFTSPPKPAVAEPRPEPKKTSQQP
jgi:hypothetical protein